MKTCEIPCKDCLCIPICRHKHYYYLIEDCTILDEFLYLDEARFIEGTSRMTTRKERFPESLNEIYETLNPTTWRSDKEVHKNVDVKLFRAAIEKRRKSK